MFSIVLSKSTLKDLKRLSKEVQRHIYSEIFPILAVNPRTAGERLKGPLSGLWKYKFTHHAISYRIVYEIKGKELVILIFGIGTRENFYKDILRRM